MTAVNPSYKMNDPSNSSKVDQPTFESEASVQKNQDFEVVLREHWNQVVSVAYRLLGDPDDAQDIALETFVQLHQHPPADRKNLKGWLYRVATRLGYNSLRSRKRRLLYESTVSTQEPNNPFFFTPSEAVEIKQEREKVRATLARLKPISAQLLILRSTGLSYTEIAKALEISPGSVGTLLARAELDFEKKFPKE